MPFSEQWFISVGAALLCIIGAATAAGLTMGLTSQDLQTLRVKKSMNPADYADEERRALVAKEKRWATKLEPLVRRHHLTLVTLLLMNAGVNEALPIFLDNIVPEWLAVVLSVTFVLIFGEIIPSAVLTGPNSLCISAGLSWFVWLIIVLLFPLSWPISKMLDLCMGEEHGMRTTFDPIEMRVRLDLEAADHEEEVRHQHEDADAHVGAGAIAKKKSLQHNTIPRSVSAQHDSLLDYHKIMRGAVNLATANAASINIKHRCITKVSCLSMDTVLDADRLAQMLHEGFSRCVRCPGLVVHPAVPRSRAVICAELANMQLQGAINAVSCVDGRSFRYPVYEGNSKTNIRGVLLTKSLILLNPETRRCVRRGV